MRYKVISCKLKKNPSGVDDWEVKLGKVMTGWLILEEANKELKVLKAKSTGETYMIFPEKVLALLSESNNPDIIRFTFKQKTKEDKPYIDGVFNE